MPREFDDFDLPVVAAPDSVWYGIEKALDRSSRPVMWPRFALAFSALILLAGVVWWRADTATDWIETRSAGTTLKIADIGSVDLAPNTKVRIVTANPSQHRLTLARGEIHAVISAPPKLFSVDTASGTAVDLGCEYSLSADADGAGTLRVERGWVAYQWHGVESMVPAGAHCRTRTNYGPGTPYFDDAPERFGNAVEAFDAGHTRESLRAIMYSARVRDTLTLWHLLSRVDAAQRGEVFDRIASLAPVPAFVSRPLALNLNSETLTHWREELAWTW